MAPQRRLRSTHRYAGDAREAPKAAEGALKDAQVTPQRQPEDDQGTPKHILEAFQRGQKARSRTPETRKQNIFNLAAVCPRYHARSPLHRDGREAHKKHMQKTFAFFYQKLHHLRFRCRGAKATLTISAAFAQKRPLND